MRAVENRVVSFRDGLSVILSIATAFGVAAGCSSSSSNSAGTGSDGGGEETGGGGVDATIDVIDNPSNCVKPGTANNAQGVGGYCNSGGGQCASAGPGGTPTLCSSDISAAPNAWFCTITCPTTCGGGAACVTTTVGSYCVPTACVGALADAGLIVSDAGVESGTVEGGGSEGGGSEGGGGVEASTNDGGAGDGAASD